tara:strand:- start:2 stop:607 length:606 start_codon:yes stop_codon:yes gene_type:complete
MINLKKAVSRFQFRFSKDNKGEFRNFKPNKEDVEAINCILTELNIRDKQTLAKNNLVAKLLVYQYTQNIRYYGTTVLSDLNFAQRDLCKVLEYPLESIYKGFHNDLHSNQLNRLIKNNDINDEIDKKIAAIRCSDIEVDESVIYHHKGLENYITHLESEKITDEEQKDIINSVAEYKKTFTFEYVTSKLNEMVIKYYNDFN